MVKPKSSCPAEATLSIITGRWKLMIIHYLLKRTQRFNELQRQLGGITHRTLAKTLKEMESDLLLVRHDHREVPPRVEYSLTDRGASLESILVAMENWAELNAESDLK